MTATTPKLGIIYPTPTDPVTNYPATAQAAATTIETWLSRMLSGVTTVGNGANVAQTPDVHVTFPAGRYTVAPVIVASAYGTALWLVGIHNLTKDGVDLYAHTKAGNPASVTGLQIHWQTMPGQTVLLAAADDGEEPEPLPEPHEQDE